MRPETVEIIEVGMRDGFQMEDRILSTDEKLEVALALIAAGARQIELTSFVSPAAIPQLADAAALVARLKGRGAELSALVPNVNGARRALCSGVDRLTVFVSASETHNQQNVRRNIAESLFAIQQIADLARDATCPLAGAVATAFGCPFEGDIFPDAVLRVVDAYAGNGVDTIILGDTTGMATPPLVEQVVGAVRQHFPELSLRLHFHNTRGIGLVNVVAGLDLGVSRFDASIGGLGGCPFAPGASGNIATEDLVYLLGTLGIGTGIQLETMIETARTVEKLFGRTLSGQVMKAGPRRGAPAL